MDNFKGQFLHPQKWNRDLDYKNKKVVVIGSGATAVTIVPAIADDVDKIVMLQRSPTYIAALPNKDKIAKIIKSILPKKIAHIIVRGKNILTGMIFYNLCRKYPRTMKKFVLKGIKKVCIISYVIFIITCNVYLSWYELYLIKYMYVIKCNQTIGLLYYCSVDKEE